ncbi:GntR family transcriptional regulator [Rummeliibacillus pycnus]|uniref:GntR family transcriptional regulator n=1 Tax=Rummeliibacillus pycnus TaxID=101070 RepID=UPI0037C66635
MKIIISNASNKPIYEQITEQLKAMIVNGDLKAGEALPSIRKLAMELRISVMTTKRAYAELENAGFIETVPGKGSFVSSSNREFLREEYLRKIEEHISKAVEMAVYADVSKKEFLEIVNLLMEDDPNE